MISLNSQSGNLFTCVIMSHSFSSKLFVDWYLKTIYCAKSQIQLCFFKEKTLLLFAYIVIFLEKISWACNKVFRSSALNTELEAQGLKKMSTVNQYGVEAVYPLFSFLDVGIRYTKRSVTQGELTAVPSTDYKAELNQDSALLIGRVPFFKSSLFHFDGFASGQ